MSEKISPITKMEEELAEMRREQAERALAREKDEELLKKSQEILLSMQEKADSIKKKREAKEQAKTPKPEDDEEELKPLEAIKTDIDNAFDAKNTAPTTTTGTKKKESFFNKESISKIGENLRNSFEKNKNRFVELFYEDEDESENRTSKNPMNAIIPKLEQLVPEYATLSDGQKMIVAQGIADRIYTKVLSTGREKLNERLGDKRFLGKKWEGINVSNPLFKRNQFGKLRFALQKEKETFDIHDTPITQEWRNTKLNINPLAFTGKVFKNIRKNFLVAGYEKNTLRELTSDTALQSEFLKKEGLEISKLVKESGLSASQNAEGKIISDFAKPLTEGFAIDAHLQKDYNEKATALSRIPYEWRTPDATRKQRAQFLEAERDYKFIQGKISIALGTEAQRSGTSELESAQLVASRLGQSKAFVQTMGFLSANPDVSENLRALGSQSKFWRGLKGVVGERGAFALGGFLAKKGSYAAYATFGTAFAGTLALASAPITAAIIGVIRGKKRAEKGLADQNRLGREGIRQKGKTVYGMGNIERHIERLEKYTQELAYTTDPAQRQQLLTELETRVDFMQKKYDLGQINFGKEDGRLSRHSQFIQALNEANAMVLVQENSDIIPDISAGLDGKRNLRNLIDAMGYAGQDKTDMEGLKKVLIQTTLSGFFGTTFALAAEELFDTGHYKEGTHGAPRSTIEKDGDATDAVQSNKEAPAQQDASKNVPSETKPVQPTTDKEATVSKTDSVTKTAPIEKTTQAPIESAKNVAPVGKVNLENSIAHVTVGKGEGAGQTLLNFRNSEGFKNLSAEQQNFFKGNIWKVTEALKEFNSKTGESAVMGVGSEFGVTNDGIIYLKDATTGEVHTLGHFDNGTFVEGHPDLVYGKAIVAETVEPSGESTEPQAYPVDENNLPETAPSDTLENEEGVEPQAYEVGQDGTSELSQEPRAENVPAENTLDDFTETTPKKEIPESLVTNPNTYTETLTAIQIKANNNYNDYLNAYFGEHSMLGLLTKPGAESENWRAIHNISAKTFLKNKTFEVAPDYEMLLIKMKDLAKADPEGPGDMSIEQYLKRLYIIDAQNEVLKKVAQ